MIESSSKIVSNVIDLSNRMIAIAQSTGTDQVEDDVAAMLCVVQDHAYRIKQTADREKVKLEISGKWKEKGK